MRRAMDVIRENMRRTNHVDDLVHQTDSPFIVSINSHSLPSKFKIFALDSYDGKHDHVITLLPSRPQCTFKGFWTR